MSQPEECIHGLGDPAFCSVCKHGPSKPEAEEVISKPFPAAYDSQCPRCDLPISEGAYIVKLSTGRYIHEDCEP